MEAAICKLCGVRHHRYEPHRFPKDRGSTNEDSARVNMNVDHRQRIADDARHQSRMVDEPEPSIIGVQHVDAVNPAERGIVCPHCGGIVPKPEPLDRKTYQREYQRRRRAAKKKDTKP